MGVDLAWPLHATMQRNTFSGHALAAVRLSWSNIWLGECLFQDAGWSVLDVDYMGSVHTRGFAPRGMNVSKDSVYQFEFPPELDFPVGTDPSLQRLQQVRGLAANFCCTCKRIM